ncbi:MAG: cytochrome c, partial [Rhizobiales bacterium]|nr:cytochrome c [Hyphomicrobiales bacterium]
MKSIISALAIYTVAALVVGGLAGLAVMYSGIFNVAATVEDAAPLKWVLVTTREAAIQSRAKAIQVPELGGTTQVENGFRFFRQECAMCHTPPGQVGTMMSKGLNPAPPPLAGLVEDMTDAELFWVTENGIRFTGMPAWYPTHVDRDLWDVVAFMRAATAMKAADYEALDRRILP